MQHERTNALTELRAAGEVLATWLNHPAATAGERHMHAVHTAPPRTLSSCIHAARDALVDALKVPQTLPATWLHHPAATVGARHMHAAHKAPPRKLSS